MDALGLDGQVLEVYRHLVTRRSAAPDELADVLGRRPTAVRHDLVDLERRGRLGPPRWPWLLVAATVVLVAATVAHWLTGVDPWQWLRSLGR